MGDESFTINKATEGFYKEKGSKFFGYAQHVSCEQTAKNCIEKLKKKHPKARHACYAYVLGFKKNIFKSSDDGEPSGTAGKPILNQIQKNNLTNVLIVVVRYFGGTLLGVSGLIRAYRKAVEKSLEAAVFIKMELFDQYSIKFRYEQQSDVQRVLKQMGVKTLNERYETMCVYDVAVKKQIKNQLLEKLDRIQHLSYIFKGEVIK
jgi:uncharacterized YigZ family protein